MRLSRPTTRAEVEVAPAPDVAFALPVEVPLLDVPLLVPVVEPLPLDVVPDPDGEPDVEPPIMLLTPVPAPPPETGS